MIMRPGRVLGGLWDIESAGIRSATCERVESGKLTYLHEGKGVPLFGCSSFRSNDPIPTRGEGGGRNEEMWEQDGKRNRVKNGTKAL